MSAAMTSTVGSSPSARITAMPAGPPAPVTNTQTRSASGMATHLGWRQPGVNGLDARAVADHLQRLGMPAAAEPRPVTRGRHNDVGLEVVATVHLRREAV